MSQSITGVDISSWNHPDGEPVDWEKAYGAGLRFVVVKATQGTGYTNPWLTRDLDDARAEGFLVGAYHYYAANEKPDLQANYFAFALGDQVLELGAWCDWECYAPQAFTHNVELDSFFGELDKVRPDAGLYCDRSWYDAFAGSSVLNRRLWLATDEVPAGAKPLIVQSVVPVSEAGIPGMVDRDVIANVRGLDLPTSPPDKPSTLGAPSAVRLARALDEGAGEVPEPPEEPEVEEPAQDLTGV
jgi:hypothetical protein